MTLTTQELNELIYCLGHVAKDKENNMVFRDVALELYIKLNEELEKRVAEEEVKQSKVVSKQTAVEWLVEQLKEFKISKDKWNYDWEDSTYLISLIEQAKQMEKEQIIKFANDYLDDDTDLTAEQYYNETYGNKSDDHTEEHLEMVSSKTEISDEEIYKEAEKHYRGLSLTRFVQGAKWYREQLKQKL